MRTNIGTLALRFLTIAPVAIAFIILAFAALFAATATRETFWILLVLSIVLGGCSVILLRCCYLAWRQPSPTTVKEVCEWTGYGLIGIAVVGFARLHSPGREWLAWTVLVVSIVAVVVVEPWLTRFLLSRVFSADLSKAA